MDLIIEILTRRGVALIRCTGRIVFGSEAESLCRQVNEVLAQSSKCVLNLGGVEQIDARGLGMLIECYREARAKGRSLILANISDTVRDLLRITKLLDVLKICSSEEAALGACGQAAYL